MSKLTLFLFQSSENYYDAHPMKRGQDLPQDGCLSVLQESMGCTQGNSSLNYSLVAVPNMDQQRQLHVESSEEAADREAAIRVLSAFGFARLFFRLFHR